MAKRKLESDSETENDPILSISEAARRCNRHRNTVTRWIADGLLRAMRMPSGMPGVRESALNRFIGASELANTLEG